MIANLEERKSDLMDKIRKLKKEVDILNGLEYRELALCRCAGSVKYLGLDSMRARGMKGHGRTAL